MKFEIKSLKKREGIKFFTNLTVLLSLILPFTALLAASSLSESLSIGLPIKGSLMKGEVIPVTGRGYNLLESTKKEKVRFGTRELVMTIKSAAFRVSKKSPGANLQVGDLSSRKGGSLDHHASHQNGRDVDLMYYATLKNKKSVKAPRFTAFDKNGYSVDPPMKYKFDTKRNYLLVKELINSDFSEVQWIFTANHLKKLMLDYGESINDSPNFLRKAKQILKQPKKNLHWDHFHVRIYCPDNDIPRCKDFGPVWAWNR
jgi:penicillin-insensitive murein endopeptidase